MENILDLLKENNRIPMHMPGHKRNVLLSPYLEKLSADLDITEIDGFDDLNNPDGILQKSMEKAAKMRGAKKAFYLVNGSTCGILAAICAVIGDGDTVICARNCHKSVYNALELAGAKTFFVNPPIDVKTGIYGSINVEDIEKKIKENPDAKLIILTSPTYEGVVSDVEKICKIAHEKNIPVLVDAAHGAHFGFGYDFPKSATQCGADIVVESLHKSLPSLTQTAICYISGSLIDEADIAEKLSVFGTSSPSYLLMASIDGCVNLLTEKGEELFENWKDILDSFYERAKDLKNIEILKNDGRFFGLDRSKIVICEKNGKKLMSDLRHLGIECEMAMPGYVIAMTGMGDTKENLMKLADCLLLLDKATGKCEDYAVMPDIPISVMPAKSAKEKPTEYVDYTHGIGRISAEYVWAYPPGVPIIIPGEEITKEIAELLQKYEACGFELKGNRKRKSGKILVIK